MTKPHERCSKAEAPKLKRFSSNVSLIELYRFSNVSLMFL